jgi:Protein of unknown function (DUF3108)
MSIRHIAYPLGAWVMAVMNAAQAADAVQPFEASYTVNWHGLTAGVSTLTLEHQQGDRWLYRSVAEARGIFRALPIGELSTQSEFEIATAGVRPLHYTADDGTSSRKRDIDVTFDWEQLRIRGVAAEEKVDEALTPGVQDDLSVQIALMRELSAGRTPEGFKTYGDRGMREYRYVRDGEETLTTAVGVIPTVIFRTERTGSPRVTRYWCAPSLGYLPVKVQQKRLDSVEFTLEVRAVKRG